MLHSLVRQWMHVWRQSMRLLEEFLALLVFDLKHTIYELCLPSERGLGMDVDLADPVSSRKFSGFSCPRLQLWNLPRCPSQSLLRRDVVWWWFFFTPGAAYDAVWDSVRPMTGKYTISYFQYQEFVGCVCMLNGWFSNIDDICADNYRVFRLSRTLPKE